MVSGPSLGALLGEFNEAVDRRLRNGVLAAPKDRRADSPAQEALAFRAWSRLRGARVLRRYGPAPARWP